MFSPRFFKNNRKKLMRCLEENSLVIFHAKDPYIKGDDSFFSQVDSNLFYFSGIEQENTILLIKKKNNSITSILFIPRADSTTQLWEGEQLTKEKAQLLSGVSKVYYRDEINSISEIVDSYSPIYLPHYPYEVGKSSATLFFENLKDVCSQEFKDITPILKTLRSVKQKEEIEALRQAITITKKGIVSVMNNCKNYKTEADIEGELSKIYTQYFSQHSFHPIVACGHNATTLHYNANNKKLKKNSLVLIDTGAEYFHYKGDITRTIPVKGRFTNRQKEIYEAVLRVQKYAFSLLKPGVNRKEYERRIVKKIGKELVSLHLLSQKKLDESLNSVREFYPHSTSHFLGLDTHDVGDYSSTIKEGEVLSVEPGIYSPDEGIGIRIEDIVVITKKGCKNLSKSIPKHIDEIEKIMNR